MYLNWFYTKFSAFMIFNSFIFDLEFLMVLFSLFLIHMMNGLKSIIFDYMHINKLNLLMYTLIRMFLMEVLAYIMEMLI